MVLLGNDAFLTELARLFQKSKSRGSGTVSVSMKRHDGRVGPEPKKKPNDKPVPKKVAKLKAAALEKKKNRPPGTSGCIVRAVLTNKKISTIVVADDVTKFQLMYCNILRSSMDSLKKMKKTKAKSKARIL